MRASVRSSLLAASLSLAAPALAGNSGIYLPQAPTGPGGEDAIETSGGTRCRQSINSNGAYVDLGVAGTAASPPPDRTNGYFGETRDREAMAYARVTIPIGPKPKRIDCSSIYELEIERLKRELDLLKMAAE